MVDDLNLIFHFNTGSETALNDFMIAGVCIGGVEWDTLSSDQKSDWHYACGTGPLHDRGLCGRLLYDFCQEPQLLSDR